MDPIRDAESRSPKPDETSGPAKQRAACQTTDATRWWVAFAALLCVPLLVLGGVSFPLLLATMIIVFFGALIAFPFVAWHVHHKHHAHRDQHH
jgi:hypothetical protein